MRFFLLVLSSFLSVSLFGQHSNLNTQRNWSLNKREVLVSFGATQFTGDLGGMDAIGTDYSLKDIDIQSTSWNIMAGYRYRFHPFFSTSSMFQIGCVRGNDALTNEIYRNNRNLHFRSLVIHLEQRIELIILANEVFRAGNLSRTRKNIVNRSNQMYCYLGGGVTYFNPKAKYQNEWIALKPLTTEGQGMDGGPKAYSLITPIIPIGLGIRMSINETWRFGFEATYYKTFTDYMDDVHGVYYDVNKLSSSASKYLADPSIKGGVSTKPGEQRGGPENDAFYSLNLVLYKNITYFKKGKVKHKGLKATKF